MDTNMLLLSSFSLDIIAHNNATNQLDFTDIAIYSVDGMTKLKDLWARNLRTFAASLDGSLPVIRWESQIVQTGVLLVSQCGTLSPLSLASSSSKKGSSDALLQLHNLAQTYS